MSNIANDLIIHWPLDELRGGKAIDVSGNSNDGRVEGSPTVVYDEVVGSSTYFKGGDATDKVTIWKTMQLKPNNGLSMEAWIKVPKGETLGIGGVIGESLNQITLSANGDLTFSEKESESLYTVNTPLEYDVWVHFACTFGRTGVKIYHNGNLALENAKHSIFEDGSIPTESFMLGGIAKAQICHFRFYQKELTAAEIKRDMLQDKSANANFRDSYPIDFGVHTLKDDNQYPVIYIEKDGTGETLEISGKNNSGKMVMFKDFPAGAKLDENNYHFQARFRKNVLGAKFFDDFAKAANKALGADWLYACGHNDAGREDWISFQRAKSGDSLPAGNISNIQIPMVNASAMGGGRNTRVEIRFDNLSYKDAKETLTGNLMRHLEIVSHVGLKNIPIVATINGSNTVLNDGSTPNTLSITVANPNADHPVRFVPQQDDAARPSQFWLSFTGDFSKLAKEVSGKKFDATPVGTRFSKILEAGNTWKFVFQDKDNKNLLQNQPLQIDISNWITDFPSGIVNIYLHYQNIPGYWDGVFVIPVELGPIVVRKIALDEKKTIFEERVGIGTVEPGSKLHINGDLRLQDSKEIIFNKDGQIRSGDDHHRIVFDAARKILELIEQGDIVLSSGSRDGKSTAKMTLKASGDMELKGRFKDQTGYVMPVGTIVAYGGKKIPDGWLLCDGATFTKEDHPDLFAVLGVGTLPDLKDRFIVGAGSSYKPTDTGGANEITLREDQLPNHVHFTFMEADHNKKVSLSISDFTDDEKQVQYGYQVDDKITAYTKWPELNMGVGKSGNPIDPVPSLYWAQNKPIENRPPYYALFYIIKC